MVDEKKESKEGTDEENIEVDSVHPLSKTRTLVEQVQFDDKAKEQDEVIIKNRVREGVGKEVLEADVSAVFDVPLRDGKIIRHELVMLVKDRPELPAYYIDFDDLLARFFTMLSIQRAKQQVVELKTNKPDKVINRDMVS
jgi:hypothetical protein